MTYAEQIAAENEQNRLAVRAIDRETYERECAAVGLAPWDEARVGRSLWLRSVDLSQWTGIALVERQLARARYNAIDAERRTSTTPAVPTATCSACGRQVSASALMNSSRGRVCPACYDHASV